MSPELSRRAEWLADRLALASLAAMVSLPFLYPRHYNPIPSFWSEWWALAFGLGAAALLLVRPSMWRPFGLPAVAAIPFAFLTTALVQYVAGRWYFVEPWLIHASYLLWTAMMMLAGRSAAHRFGLTRLADVIAAAVLMGALCNTITAALQYHDAGYASGLVFLRISKLAYSNLGQANHFNHQLWLGIASLFYLHLRGYCRLSVLLPAALLLLVASTMSLSKSVLLYALAFTVLAWLMRRKLDGNPVASKLWSLSLPLLPTVLLLQWLVPTTGLAGDAMTPLATQRLFGQTEGFDIRWRLAWTAWHSFIAAPWLGQGVGTMSWQFFEDSSRYAPGLGPMVAEHAHNLPLQLLAEFGIVPVAMMLWLLASWALALWRQQWQLEHWWLVAMLSVAAIHSLLEYPLWYAFFLGPVALLLGAAARPAMMLDNGRRGAAMCALVVAAGLLPLVSMRIDYGQLEETFNHPVASADANAWQIQAKTLTSIQRNSLLAPYVMATLSMMMALNDRDLDAKVEVCRQSMKFAPTRTIVFKCASLMAMAGDEAGAIRLLDMGLHAYPKDAPRVLKDLNALAPTYPRLKPLLPLVHGYAVKAVSPS